MACDDPFYSDLAKVEKRKVLKGIYQKKTIAAALHNANYLAVSDCQTCFLSLGVLAGNDAIQQRKSCF